MNSYRDEMTVRETKARIFRIRKRDLEQRMQQAMMKRCQVMSKISQLESERSNLDRQVLGLRSQISEIDKEI